MTSMKGRGYNLNMKLTSDEHTTYRKALHLTEAKSMSAFIRECVRLRLVSLGFATPDPGTLRTESQQTQGRLPVFGHTIELAEPAEPPDSRDIEEYAEVEKLQASCLHKNFNDEDGCLDCGYYAK